MPKRAKEVYYLSLTWAVEEVGGQLHGPAALSPGKRHSALCTRSWVSPRLWYGWMRKISPPTGIRSLDRNFVLQRSRFSALETESTVVPF